MHITSFNPAVYCLNMYAKLILNNFKLFTPHLIKFICNNIIKRKKRLESIAISFTDITINKKRQYNKELEM